MLSVLARNECVCAQEKMAPRCFEWAIGASRLSTGPYRNRSWRLPRGSPRIRFRWSKAGLADALPRAMRLKCKRNVPTAPEVRYLGDLAAQRALAAKGWGFGIASPNSDQRTHLRTQVPYPLGIARSLKTPEGTPIPSNSLDEIRRDMVRLDLVRQQIDKIERTRLEHLEKTPEAGPYPMVRFLASIVGVGIETADMLVTEVLSRNLRDRRAVGRYAGLTGAPDESGKKRREKGLAKAGNSRVRRGLIQLAWRFLRFQKESALVLWFQKRTEGPSAGRKTKLIVALARKLLIALWRMVTTGEVPAGVVLRPAAS